MKNTVFIIMSGIIIVTGIFFGATIFIRSSAQKSEINDYEIKQVIINGKHVINAQLARTSDQRTLGLAGRTSLSDNSGMLFEFEKPDYHTFWMNGMLIPIDILWIHNGTIVHIEKNVPPPKPQTVSTNLPVYRPASQALWVLETNSGYTDRNTIKVGDTVEIK